MSTTPEKEEYFQKKTNIDEKLKGEHIYEHHRDHLFSKLTGDKGDTMKPNMEKMKLKQIRGKPHFKKKNYDDMVKLENKEAETKKGEMKMVERNHERTETVNHIGKKGKVKARVEYGEDKEGREVRRERWTDPDTGEEHEFNGRYKRGLFSSSREEGTHTVEGRYLNEQGEESRYSKEFTGTFKDDKYEDGFIKETHASYNDHEKRTFDSKYKAMKKEGNTYKGSLHTSKREEGVGEDLKSFGEYDENDKFKRGVEYRNTHGKSRAAGFEEHHIKYEDEDDTLIMSRRGGDFEEHPTMNKTLHEREEYGRYNEYHDEIVHHDKKTGHLKSVKETRDHEGTLKKRTIKSVKEEGEEKKSHTTVDDFQTGKKTIKDGTKSEPGTKSETYIEESEKEKQKKEDKKMREKDEQMQRLQAKEEKKHSVTEDDFKGNPPLSQEDFKKDKEIRENTPDIDPFFDTQDPTQAQKLYEDVQDPTNFQQFQQDMSSGTTTEIENNITTNVMKNASSVESGITDVENDLDDLI